MEVDSAPPPVEDTKPSTDAPSPSTSSIPAAHPPTNGTTPTPQNGTDSEMKEATPAGPSLPDDCSEVIYINNLNEKIKIDVMKQSLRTLFKQYSKVLDVVAHRSIRMRGQAFVTLDSREAAAKAVKEVNAFPLYGKPMQLAFAKTKSDAIVKATTPEDFEKHKVDRLVRK
ncbi:hypothetical protein P7C70_g9502, partial [Phenoliferia sp. Uapishka_3]